MSRVDTIYNFQYIGENHYGFFFQRTQERVRNSRGKRAISVRATEGLLYFIVKKMHISNMQGCCISLLKKKDYSKPHGLILIITGNCSNELLDRSKIPKNGLPE